MPKDTTDHLAMVRECLAIAESGDAKREAYKKAAEHIAAYKEATGATNRAIAAELQFRSKSEQSAERIVGYLLKWRESGFKAATPFLMDENATGRAARSHAKAVLRNPVEAAKVFSELSDDEIKGVDDVVTEERVERLRPEVERGNQDQRAKRTKRLKENPLEALLRFGSTLSSGRVATRSIAQSYQEFLALVSDEDVIESGRDMLIAYRAAMDVALGEVLEGSYEDALARLVTEEASR